MSNTLQLNALSRVVKELEPLFDEMHQLWEINDDSLSEHTSSAERTKEILAFRRLFRRFLKDDFNPEHNGRFAIDALRSWAREEFPNA